MGPSRELNTRTTIPTMHAMLTHLHQHTHTHTHTYMFCCGSQSCLEHATRDRTDSVMHEYTFNKFRNYQSKYEIRSSFRISKHARTLQATNHSVGAPLPEPQLGWAGRLATPHAICHRLGGSRMQRIGMSLARHPTRVPVQVLAN